MVGTGWTQIAAGLANNVSLGQYSDGLYTVCHPEFLPSLVSDCFRAPSFLNWLSHCILSFFILSFATMLIVQVCLNYLQFSLLAVFFNDIKVISTDKHCFLLMEVFFEFDPRFPINVPSCHQVYHNYFSSYF